MKKLNVYLIFAGNCQEALNFYKECLGGQILSSQTYADSPVQVPDDYKSKVIHAEFKSDGIYFMAADTLPGQPVNLGNNVTLTINLNDAQEQELILSKLSLGGQMIMPLQDTFWGAKFAMLKDKFGIVWMLNCETSK